MGRDQKASEGRYSGGSISTGFEVLNQEIVIEEEELAIVRLIFKPRKKKLSTYRITQILNEQGIHGKKNRKWYPAGIRKVLNNKLYKGWPKHGKVYYKSQLGKVI